MYCQHCGKELAPGKPCGNCSVETSSVGNELSYNSAPEKKKKSKTIYFLLYTFFGIALIGTLAALIIPALAGEKSNGAEAIKSGTFFTAILFTIRASQAGKSKVLWAFSVVVVVVVGIAASFVLVAASSFISGKRQVLERSLAAEAVRINKTLPKNTSDGEATMVSVSTSGKKIIYNLKLITATKKDFSKDDIEVHKKSLKEGICKTPVLETAFEKGVSVEYVYSDKNEELVMTGIFDKEICKQQ